MPFSWAWMGWLSAFLTSAVTVKRASLPEASSSVVTSGLRTTAAPDVARNTPSRNPMFRSGG
jgi:hypothetical protein